jgi:DNA-binding response OmpR family regulator
MEERAPDLSPAIKGKVLVVDDEPSILRLLQSIIEKRGYKVFTAASGVEALVKASAGDFDLIILDLVLPGMDGLDLLERLRQSSATEDTPVAILTTQTREMAESRPGIRADWYIRKPFDPSEILQLLPR